MEIKVKDADLITKKKPKCINFNALVLKKIEERAKSEGTTVSNLVNSTMRRKVMKDKEFYLMMAKSKCAEMNFYKTLADGVLE